MPSEDDDLTTLTVTIALDDDNGDQRHGHQDNLLPCSASAFSLEKYYVIRAPISPEHACPVPTKNVKISDLSSKAQTLLCNKLNAPAIGSMRNWHYLAAIIGLKDDDIARLRRTDDPMMGVLESVFDISLARLITAIGEIGRIDVLISLKPHIHGISANKKLLQSAPPPPVNERPMNERFDSAITESIKISNFQFPTKKFIIITYHETDKANKKLVKFLLSALQKVADKCNIDILDIAKCIDETNISQTARNLFKHASHIVLFISSPDYKSHIFNSSSTDPSSNSNNAITTVKRLFHCWMDEEYHSNGCRNFRFRVIINDKCGSAKNDILPSGWPQTTLQYTFPDDNQFKDICIRLFE